MPRLDGPTLDFQLLKRAYDLSRSLHGNYLDVYVPGMFSINGHRGKYHAVSITGRHCALNCDHCGGSLLNTMPDLSTPADLVEYGGKIKSLGHTGLLVSGGCDEYGRLPWGKFAGAVTSLKKLGLVITAHTGMVGRSTAELLKNCGIDQALVDVVGSDETLEQVYHAHYGVHGIESTLAALCSVGIETVPHIVFGLHYGNQLGEDRALKIIARYNNIKKYVIVVLTPNRETPMMGIAAPAPELVANFIATARLELPLCKAGLGCARPRGRYSKRLEFLAIHAGVNSMALYSDEALAEAKKLGLPIRYNSTCCSLDPMV